jgi:hypothetical protein
MTLGIALDLICLVFLIMCGYYTYRIVHVQRELFRLQGKQIDLAHETIMKLFDKVGQLGEAAEMLRKQGNASASTIMHLHEVMEQNELEGLAKFERDVVN